ncbi:hypothetical protein RUM43_012504 [Polyplax serrata]|uniref:Syndecan n=1 Tax=Polyplax serrata TaxID=468196 RepID=A0AAN8NKT7_POLSC
MKEERRENLIFSDAYRKDDIYLEDDLEGSGIGNREFNKDDLESSGSGIGIDDEDSAGSGEELTRGFILGDECFSYWKGEILMVGHMRRPKETSFPLDSAKSLWKLHSRLKEDRTQTLKFNKDLGNIPGTSPAIETKPTKIVPKEPDRTQFTFVKPKLRPHEETVPQNEIFDSGSRQPDKTDEDLNRDRSSTEHENTVIMDPKHEERATSFFAQPGILAAVIGGCVVGLLCAILVVMFIVYRMRKKDEGSYPLDEPKRSPTSNSYTKNSQREFYA